MIFVLGSMTFRPTDLPRLETGLKRMMAATRAEVGCDHYALATDLIDPATVQVSERWRDQAGFGAHLVSDHVVAFNFDVRAGQIQRARVDSFHPGGEARKLIDVNAGSVRITKDNPARVIVMGTASLAPGEIDRLADAMRTQIEATRAEDGCEHYSFARDLAEPDLLHITERWRDNAALSAHFATPHMATFNAVLGGADVRGLRVKAYDDGGERLLMGG